MKFENTKVYNISRAIYSARNAMESWDKSDSDLEKEIIGQNDLDLAQRLIKAGSEHRKFLRQIFVGVDITAPLFWWKEFDTYKVGTVANSTSTMHKLSSTPITMNCFETDGFSIFETDLNDIEKSMNSFDFWNLYLIPYLEKLRVLFNETKDKRYWKELIRLLPESWLQKRTVTMNYENILNMYMQRRNHKLNEWSVKDDPTKSNFCSWVLELPYTKQFFIEPFEKVGDKNDRI